MAIGAAMAHPRLLVASSDRRLMVCIMAVMIYLLQLTEEMGRSCKAR